jgi:hypothetical protein
VVDVVAGVRGAVDVGGEDGPVRVAPEVAGEGGNQRCPALFRVGGWPGRGRGEGVRGSFGQAGAGPSARVVAPGDAGVEDLVDHGAGCEVVLLGEPASAGVPLFGWPGAEDVGGDTHGGDAAFDAVQAVCVAGDAGGVDVSGQRRRGVEGGA